jgi:hypothetical protein
MRLLRILSRSFYRYAIYIYIYIYILTRILKNRMIHYSEHEHTYKRISNYFPDSLLLNKTNLLLMELQTSVSYKPQDPDTRKRQSSRKCIVIQTLQPHTTYAIFCSEETESCSISRDQSTPQTFTYTRREGS